MCMSEGERIYGVHVRVSVCVVCGILLNLRRSSEGRYLEILLVSPRQLKVGKQFRPYFHYVLSF